MARSVSIHRHAVATVYLQLPDMDGDDWDFFLDDVRSVLIERYPSLGVCDRWAGREDHVILENGRGEVSVSGYYGLASVCLAPLDPDNPLDQGWCCRSAGGFETYVAEKWPDQALVSVGRFSNGEQIFKPANRPEGMVTSKEGTLW